MGDLDIETRVSPAGAPGRYTAKLHDAWAIWGPNGGYVASVLLRAMAAEADVIRPASFSCHYLGVAAFDEVELSVTTLRATKRAQSLRVSMTQGGQPIAEALAWFVADLEALSHDARPAPAVPPPAEVPTVEERLPEDQPPFVFWHNVENRPLLWEDDWLQRKAGDPRTLTWFRFRPTATFEDPAVDACRLLVVLDTMQWPAAARAYTHDELTHIAPSLDLSVVFHRLAPEEDYLLVESTSPAATDGMVGGQAAAWAGGRLLATSVQQMLCRPAPPLPG